MRNFTAVHRMIVGFLSCLAVVMITGCAQMPSQTGTFASCSTYSSQKSAQKAWEAAGSPNAASRDRDGDGVVCETLKGSSGGTTASSSSSSSKSGTAKTTNCVLTDKVVDIGISKTKYPQVLQHMEESVKEGYPRVWKLNRAGAGERRKKLLQGIPTKPGFDRDEAPAAVARPTYRASVKLIDSSQNRGAGSVMGLKLRRYCDGQKFQLVGY